MKTTRVLNVSNYDKATGAKRSTATWLWVLLTAIAPAVWGTTYIVTQKALPSASPVWSTVFRALPAGILGLCLARRVPRGEWIWKSAAMGILNMGVFFPLLFVSAYRLPGGIASVLSACQPLFIVGLSWLLQHQPPSAWRLVWGVVGVGGIALMVLTPHARTDAWGIAAGIIATASMSTGVVLTKKWGRPVGGFTWATWLLSWAGLIAVPFAVVIEGTPPSLNGRAWAGYAWLSLVGALLTYWVWFTGLGRISVGQASFLPLLSPIVATLLGGILAGEALRAQQWVGFSICLAAILMAQLPTQRQLRRQRRSTV